MRTWSFRLGRWHDPIWEGVLIDRGRVLASIAKNLEPQGRLL